MTKDIALPDAPIVISPGPRPGHTLEVSTPVGFIGRVVLICDEVAKPGHKRNFVFSAYVTHSASPATISIPNHAKDILYADLRDGIDAGLLEAIEKEMANGKHDPPPPGVTNGGK